MSYARFQKICFYGGLIGLAIMIYPLLFPGALGIVLSMGVGHVFGIAAASLYLLAVVLDMARRRDP